MLCVYLLVFHTARGSSRLRGRDGADTWMRFGILTYNLDRMVTVRATR